MNNTKGCVKLRVIAIFALIILFIMAIIGFFGNKNKIPIEPPIVETTTAVAQTTPNYTEPTTTDNNIIATFSYSDVPEYSGEPYYIINNNIPYFKPKEITVSVFENYSELDTLGRCGVAFANICTEIMPTEPRGKIGMVRPSGWDYNGKSNNNKYDFVDGKYIYNRCHLIGYQLAGENANNKNLVTGTRYFNVIGMLPFENMVDDFIEENNSYHVLYRVTPVFIESELVCRGVLMEAYSVEDNGAGIKFCVFVYNVQPGVYINYNTGQNQLN